VPRLEGRARDPRVEEGAPVRRETFLPVALPDDDAAADRLHVGQEFGAQWHASERRLVEPVDEVTRLLELYREEERGGDGNLLAFHAAHFEVAGRELRGPEGEALRVGRAAQEVAVLLRGEEDGVVNFVAGELVVGDRQRGDAVVGNERAAERV